MAKTAQSQSTSYENIPDSTLNFTLGTYVYSPSTFYFNGLIDEFKLSDSAISQEEIKSAAQKSPYSIYTSPIIDLTLQPSEATLSWSSTNPTSTDFHMEYRTSTDSISWSNWSSLSTESLIEKFLLL